MRPRGLSASSPVARNVGQAWRQNPQCTQVSRAANPPRGLGGVPAASTGTVIAFDRDRERVARIEGAAQAGDQRPDPLAVGTEVSHRAPQGPGSPFDGERHFEDREGAPQAP